MSSILLPLAVLACPVSMVVMMLMMSKGHDNAPKEQDELAILKKRYAKGEISDEEYERMKQKLTSEDKE